MSYARSVFLFSIIQHIYIYAYSKTSLNRWMTKPILSGPLRKVVGLVSKNIAMVDRFGPKESDRYRRVVDLWRWSVREVLLYIYIYVVQAIIRV